MKTFFLLTMLNLLSVQNIYSQKKFLFDATKSETAGNADWVIDEDNKTAGRYPTPAQSTIVSGTSESYWTGALSSWGIELVKAGYTVESLPSGTAITYGNSGNPQDLSNYAVYVVDEPGNLFTQSEKDAIVNYVKNGGGLFMISDHAGAIRSSGGVEALHAWNDLMRTNSVQSNPFGFMIDSITFSETSVNLTSDASNPVINGSQGKVTSAMWSSGTSAHLQTGSTASVTGLLWRTTSTRGGSTGIMALSALYGKGKVVFVGDSSPADDGTGSTGHTLYPGWTEQNGDHARLHMNASIWLADKSLTGTADKTTLPVSLKLLQNYPNPFNPSTEIKFDLPAACSVSLTVFNMLGKQVAELVNGWNEAGNHSALFNAPDLSSGVYYYQLRSGSTVITNKMILMK